MIWEFRFKLSIDDYVSRLTELGLCLMLGILIIIVDEDIILVFHLILFLVCYLLLTICVLFLFILFLFLFVVCIK